MRVNITFLIVLIIAAITIISDSIIYFLNCNYELAIIIGALITILISTILIKKNKIKPEKNFDKLDVVFLALFLIYTGFKIIIPDTSWDVYMYHIYLQETPFIDKVNFDFFAGLSRNSFLFPLGDRMFYIFRHFLGYRLGTILSYFSIIVLYYQIKNMLKLFIEEKYTHIICIISAVISLLPSTVNMLLGTYYIDLLSLILQMQLVYYAFSIKDIFKNKFDKYLLFFIAGIAMGIKISNLILLIPIAIYIIIKNIKNLKQVKWYEYILLFIILIVPFFTYMYDNYMQMGNPLYPFLADVFTSEYFGKFACIDSRYGVSNIFESIIWPIVVMINPRKGDESYHNNWVLGIGYIVAIIYTIVYILSKILKKDLLNKELKNNKIFELSSLIVIMSVLWANFLMGYQRYGIILSILMSILMAIITIKIFTTSKNLFSIMLVSSVFVCSNVLSINLNLTKLFNTYSYARVFEKYNDGESYRNLEYIFKDREKQTIKIDGVWGVIWEDSAISTLVRDENTPIYILDKEELDKNNATEETYKRYYDNIKNNKVYVASLNGWFEDKIEELNKYGFKIVGNVKVYKDLMFTYGPNVCYIFQVEYSDEYVGKEVNKIENMIYEY